MAELGRADGWVNLARVYQKEGRIPDALAALEKAAEHKEPAAPWVINWLTGQINASNGLLDEAIDSFESVLATKVPDRKFDFSLDYEVINELALGALRPGHERAGRRVRSGATISRRRSRPIAAPSPSIPRTSAPTTAWAWPTATRPGATSSGRARAAACSTAGRQSRAARARRSREAGRLDRRSQGPPRPSAGRGRCGWPATSLDSWTARGRAISRGWSRCTRWSRSWARPGTRETDPDAGPALAQALEVTHERLHERLKPDETAEGRAFRLARQRDPAANLNAQSIVIHSLHRPGAPGIDQPVTTAARRSIDPRPPRPPPLMRPTAPENRRMTSLESIVIMRNV